MRMPVCPAENRARNRDEQPRKARIAWNTPSRSTGCLHAIIDTGNFEVCITKRGVNEHRPGSERLQDYQGNRRASFPATSRKPKQCAACSPYGSILSELPP